MISIAIFVFFLSFSSFADAMELAGKGKGASAFMKPIKLDPVVAKYVRMRERDTKQERPLKEIVHDSTTAINELAQWLRCHNGFDAERLLTKELLVHYYGCYASALLCESPTAEQYSALLPKLVKAQANYGTSKNLKRNISRCYVGQGTISKEALQAFEDYFNVLRKTDSSSADDQSVLKEISKRLGKICDNSGKKTYDPHILSTAHRLFGDCCLYLLSIDDELYGKGLWAYHYVRRLNQPKLWFNMGLLAYTMGHFCPARGYLQALCDDFSDDPALVYKKAQARWFLGMTAFLSHKACNEESYNEFNKAMELINNDDEDKFFADCYYDDFNTSISDVALYLKDMYSSNVVCAIADPAFIDQGYLLGRLLAASDNRKYRDIGLNAICYAATFKSERARRYILDTLNQFAVPMKAKSLLVLIENPETDQKSKESFMQQLQGYAYKEGSILVQAYYLLAIINGWSDWDDGELINCLNDLFYNASFALVCKEHEMDTEIAGSLEKKLLQVIMKLKQHPSASFFLARHYFSALRNAELSPKVIEAYIRDAATYINRAHISLKDSKQRPSWWNDYYAYMHNAIGDIIQNTLKSDGSIIGSALHFYARAWIYDNKKALYNFARMLILGSASNDDFKKVCGFGVTNDQRKRIGCFLMERFLQLENLDRGLVCLQQEGQRLINNVKTQCVTRAGEKCFCQCSNKDIEKQVHKMQSGIEKALAKTVALGKRIEHEEAKGFSKGSPEAHAYVTDEQMLLVKIHFLTAFLQGERDYAYSIALDYINAVRNAPKSVKQSNIDAVTLDALLSNSSNVRAEYLIQKSQYKKNRISKPYNHAQQEQNDFALAKKIWQRFLEKMEKDKKIGHDDLSIACELSENIANFHGTFYSLMSDFQRDLMGELIMHFVGRRDVTMAEDTLFDCYHLARILFCSNEEKQFQAAGSMLSSIGQMGYDKAQQFIFGNDKQKNIKKLLPVDLCALASAILSKQGSKDTHTQCEDVLKMYAQQGYLWGQYCKIVLIHDAVTEKTRESTISNPMDQLTEEFQNFFTQCPVDLVNNNQGYYNREWRDGNIWLSLNEQNLHSLEALCLLADSGNVWAQLFLARVYCLCPSALDDKWDSKILQYMENCAEKIAQGSQYCGFLAGESAAKNRDVKNMKKYFSWIDKAQLWGDAKARFMYAKELMFPELGSNDADSNESMQKKGADLMEILLFDESVDMAVRKAAFAQLGTYHRNDIELFLQKFGDLATKLNIDIPNFFGRLLQSLNNQIQREEEISLDELLIVIGHIE